MPKFKDLTGQRFGLLVVTNRGTNDKKGRTTWICQCDCGSPPKTVASYRLCSGQTKSCGCLKHTEIDLTGKMFGELIVIAPTERFVGRERMWTCLCSCGKTKEISGHALRGSKTISCGHIATDNKKLIDGQRLFERTRIGNLTDTPPINNTSGTRGVCWHKKANKWHAYLNISGKHVSCGVYSKKEDAIKARKLAEEKYFEPIIEKYKKEAGA